ncbi:hypothetical protein [Phocaeicola dorei]|uniref:hypothetical protein n=1 Tax=Phocaeicola dorei TaxID=357276 RepID=UPI00356A1E99
MESESVTNHTAIPRQVIRTVRHTGRAARIDSVGYCSGQLPRVLVVFLSSC